MTSILARANQSFRRGEFKTALALYRNVLTDLQTFDKAPSSLISTTNRLISECKRRLQDVPSAGSKNNTHKILDNSLWANDNYKSKIDDQSLLPNTCIVLGNGPSMRGFDLHRLSGLVTLGMNAAYRHWDRIGWYPNFYACLDDQLIKTHHLEIERLFTNGLVKKVFVHGAFFEKHPHRLGHPDFTSFDQTSEYWFKKQGKQLGLAPIYHFPAFRMTNPSKITTGSHSIRFIAHLGFERIITMGIDLKYVEIIPEASPTEGNGLLIKDTPISNPNYFFDDYQQAGDLYNIPNPTSHSGLLHEQALALVAEDFRIYQLPTSIYNANHKSVLSQKDIFPYINISDVLLEQKLGCVFIPTNANEIESLEASFKLWRLPEYAPFLSQKGPKERPRLVIIFNHTSCRVFTTRLAELFAECSLDCYFDQLVFEFLDLEGDRDHYIKDYTKNVGETGYKAGPNNQFFQSIRRVKRHGLYGFLMETDCLPIRAGWLETISECVNNSERFWVMGSNYRGIQQLSSDFVRHINGNAIYAVGDHDFQQFVTSFWEHHTWRLVKEKDKRLAYDCILEIMFSEPHIREPGVMETWKNIAPKIRYTDLIQNISGAEDLARTDETLVSDLRVRYPDTMILHNRAVYTAVVKKRLSHPAPLATNVVGAPVQPRLLVFDMTASGNQTATGQIKANIFAEWDEDRLLHVCKQGPNGLAMCRKRGTTWQVNVTDMDGALETTEAFAPELILYRPVPDTEDLHALAMKTIRNSDTPTLLWIMDDWPARMNTEEPKLWEAMSGDFLWLLARSAFRLSICEDMSAVMARRYGVPFIPIANGVEPADWAGIQPRTQDLDIFLLRYAGGVAIDMNRASIFRVAEAVEKIAATGVSIRFEISTQSWWKKQIEADLSEFQHTCIELADKTIPEYREWISQSDANLIAYNFDEASLRYSATSFGNKVPEYMASGVPLIAHGPMEAATIRYLAKHGCATVIDSENVADLIKAISSLIIRDSKSAELARTAQDRAFADKNIHDIRRTFRRLACRASAMPTPGLQSTHSMREYTLRQHEVLMASLAPSSVPLSPVLHTEGQPRAISSEIDKFIADARHDGQLIERMIRRFYRGLNARDIFVDGGAHHGYHTSYARRFFSRVISVEASARTFSELVYKQTDLASQQPTNQALGENVPVYGALGFRQSQGAVVDFYFSESHPGRSTVNTAMWNEWAKGSVIYQNSISVPVVEIDDLDKLYATDRRVDFLKLDLEGGEINAIRGARGMLLADQPAIVMEFGMKPGNEGLYGESCKEFVELMGACGYDLYTPWAARAEELILVGYPFWYLFCFPRGPRGFALSDWLAICFSESLAEVQS
jgi:FkbM family methyltransferase